MEMPVIAARRFASPFVYGLPKSLSGWAQSLSGKKSISPSAFDNNRDSAGAARPTGNVASYRRRAVPAERGKHRQLRLDAFLDISFGDRCNSGSG